MENIIFCAETLKKQLKIKFIICGTGPYKVKLEEIVITKQLSNISFLPLQEKQVFNDFLNMVDIHLVLQKGNAADLVMPSKLTNILAVGGPSIVTALPGTSLYNLISRYNVGVIVKPDDFNELAEVILKASNQSMDEKRENARAYALQYLNVDNVMQKFVNDIKN